MQSNVALNNQHKSNMDYLILDRKIWDFQIRIIVIQIKLFELLAPGHNRITVCQCPISAAQPSSAHAGKWILILGELFL